MDIPTPAFDRILEAQGLGKEQAVFATAFVGSVFRSIADPSELQLLHLPHQKGLEGKSFFLYKPEIRILTEPLHKPLLRAIVAWFPLISKIEGA